MTLPIKNIEEGSIHHRSCSPLNPPHPVDAEGKRHRCQIIILVGLCFFAIFVAFTVRICLSQAMIPMAKVHHWKESQQGILFGAFYYGYILSIIPGGWISQNFGSKYVILFGILGSSLLNSMSPLASDFSYDLFLVLRMMVGLVQGVFWPSCVHLLSEWIHTGKNKSLAIAIVISGQHLGTAAAQGLYPILAESYGWQMPFYVIGMLGIIWSVLWCIYIQSKPNDDIENQHRAVYSHQQRPISSHRGSNAIYHKLARSQSITAISQGEDTDDNDSSSFKHHEALLSESKPSLALVACEIDDLVISSPLERDQPQQIQMSSTADVQILAYLPWWKIFTYKSVWAYYILFFCYNWSFYLLVSYLPKYLNFVLGFSLSSSGHLAVMAYLGLYFTLLIGGRGTAYYLSQGGSGVTRCRKLGVTIGLLPTVILIGIAIYLSPTSVTNSNANAHRSSVTIASLMIIAIGMTGIAHSSFAPNPMDLSPRSPAMIASFGNVVATIPGFLSSYVAGHILQSGDCTNEYPVSASCQMAWKGLFALSVAFYCIGWFVWLAFASGNPLKKKN